MPWVKLTDDWYEDAAIIEVGPTAGWMWLLIHSMSIRNGYPDSIPLVVARRNGGPRWKATMATLESAGLVVIDGDHFTLIRPTSIIPVANPVRPTIPQATRRFVYERDGHQCVTCGSIEDLTLDHIIPYSVGGPDTTENLRTLCRPCNSRRGTGGY